MSDTPKFKAGDMVLVYGSEERTVVCSAPDNDGDIVTLDADGFYRFVPEAECAPRPKRYVVEHRKVRAGERYFSRVVAAINTAAYDYDVVRPVIVEEL